MTITNPIDQRRGLSDRVRAASTHPPLIAWQDGDSVERDAVEKNAVEGGTGAFELLAAMGQFFLFGVPSELSIVAAILEPEMLDQALREAIESVESNHQTLKQIESELADTDSELEEDGIMIAILENRIDWQAAAIEARQMLDDYEADASDAGDDGHEIDPVVGQRLGVLLDQMDAFDDSMDALIDVFAPVARTYWLDNLTTDLDLNVWWDRPSYFSGTLEATWEQLRRMQDILAAADRQIEAVAFETSLGEQPFLLLATDRQQRDAADKMSVSLAAADADIEFEIAAQFDVTLDDAELSIVFELPKICQGLSIEQIADTDPVRLSLDARVPMRPEFVNADGVIEREYHLRWGTLGQTVRVRRQAMSPPASKVILLGSAMLSFSDLRVLFSAPTRRLFVRRHR